MGRSGRAEILRKFGLTDGKSANTSIDTEKPLLKDPDGKDVDVHIYRQIINDVSYKLLLFGLMNDVVHLMLLEAKEKQIEEEQAAKAQNSKIPVCYDDEDDYNSAITPVETVDSLSMGDEHLDTIPATKSDEFIKSCIENLVSNPSESEDENGCDMPACCTTFSNILFEAEYESDSSDDQSLSDDDVPKKIYSNPFFDEEIIPMEIDLHSYNAESDLIESMPNHDSSIIISLKIDSLFDEFAGELTLFKSIPPGIDETDCHPKEEIRLTKRLLYDNSSPSLSEEIVFDNSNADIESFSPSPIPNLDSNPLMEEIDLSFNLDDPMPLGIEDDDYDSGRDILILEELLDNYSLSLPANESYHLDIPSPYRPPTKPPDGNIGTLNIKMMGDDYDQKVPIHGLTITRILNQEKSPDLLSHQGLEAFQPSAECPMIINGNNIPLLDIDSLFDEFAGELTLLKSIPSVFDETDCHPKKETRFAKRLLYDNSSPRPPEEIIFDNSNADIESFSPSPIPNKDSDSHMEEIDLSFNPDDPMLPGIEDDDYDSGRDIPILEELLDNYSLVILFLLILEIFAELARMGYEKPSTKLTFYKAFFSAQWKFLSHTIVQCMSAKRTAWNEFSSFMASAVICLVTGRRIGKGFSRVETPLFDDMLVKQQVQDNAKVQEDEDDNEVSVAPTPPSPTPRLPSSSKGQEVREAEGIQISKFKEIKEGYTDEVEPAKVKEVLEVVTAAKLMKDVVTTTAPITTAAQVPKASASRKRRGVVIQDPEETVAASVIAQTDVKSKDKGKGILIEEPKALKRNPLTEAQARKNMMKYLKNMAGFKMDFVKGMTYSEIRPIFEKHYNLIQDFLEKGEGEITVQEEGSKRKGKSLKQKAAKKQRIDEEAEELKRHLQIVVNDDDDIYTKATPLASKVIVVDYQIHHENNKPYYKIIRADGTHKLFLSFITLLKNFDREYLEALWKLVKDIFKSTEPKNFSDDFLLNTLKIMFEKPNVEANVGKSRRADIDNVRLEFKKESKMSLELLRLVRRQLKEGYVPE
uniref:Uncharacterized protein n=1 Tax=Tanacetum cinerariifolium TaxID=118510 RepID=A0A6L2KCW4_TANCI|nr:hypothetical protein [Tanacetum cinerariifolium]